MCRSAADGEVSINSEIGWVQSKDNRSKTGEEFDYEWTFSFFITGIEVIKPVLIIVSKITEEFYELLNNLNVEQLLIDWNKPWEPTYKNYYLWSSLLR